MSIHPSSVITGKLELGEGAQIGPYCLIQGNVKIGPGTIVEGHASIGCEHGVITIGSNNRIHPGAVIGGPPQDISYKSEETYLKIGDHNVFREFSTVNLATSKGDKLTEIGNHNYFMSYTHIGHDCKVGNKVVISNNSHVGGHCEIGNNVVIGGMCAFNQFTKLGDFSFVAGGSVVVKDILPFSRAQGNHAYIRATNKVGMLRNGFSKDDVNQIHKAIRIFIMGNYTSNEALEVIAKECQPSDTLSYFINFIKSSKRGIARPLGKGQEEDAE